MYTLLLIILILDSLILVASILLQSAKGGGLAASFGGVTTAADALIGTRQAGNLLTKTAWWAGGVFLFLSFVLQIMSTRPTAPRSILEQQAAPTAPAGTPATVPATKAPQSAVPLSPAPKSSPPQPSGTTKKP